ncbi:hypothetical protein P5V15_013563 [Pogonomyrmex californicus]
MIYVQSISVFRVLRIEIASPDCRRKTRCMSSIRESRTKLKSFAPAGCNYFENHESLAIELQNLARRSGYSPTLLKTHGTSVTIIVTKFCKTSEHRSRSGVVQSRVFICTI